MPRLISASARRSRPSPARAAGAHAGSAAGRQPAGHRLSRPVVAPGRRAPAAPRQVAFWLLALMLAVTMLGTTLPTPLYVIYQARWHFSAALVTVTFAVCAAAVIATLLLAGRASDQAGRRPVQGAAWGPAR
jgi:hypothetical protein